MSNLKRAINWLCFLFILAIPFQTHWLYDQQLLNEQSWQYGALRLYGTEILLLLIFCLAVTYLTIDFIRQKRWKNLQRPATKATAIAIFFLVIFINVFLAINPTVSFYRWEILISGMALTLILSIFCRKKQILAALTISGTLQSLLALQQFFSQKINPNKWLGIAEQNPATLGAPVIEIADGRFLRAFGAFPHPNMLGGFLVFTLLAAIYLLLSEKAMKRRRWLLFAAALNFIGLLTTFSRSAWLAFFVGTTILIIFELKAARRERSHPASIRNHERNKLFKSLFLLFFCISIAFFAAHPRLFLSRFDMTNRLEIKSVNERLISYSEDADIAKKFYFFGTGTGNYTIALAETIPGLDAWQYQPIHNIFLLIFAELGAIGIILLTAAWRLIRKNFNVRLAGNWPWIGAILTIGLLDHYLWSMYVGAILTAIIAAIILFPHESSN